MKISANLFLLVVTVVMILDRVPPAEGLKCYICRGDPVNDGSTWREGETGKPAGRQGPIGTQQIGKIYGDSFEDLQKQLANATSCQDMAKSTEKKHPHVDDCPPNFKNPFCATHKKLGRYCTTAGETGDDPVHLNECPANGTICRCNTADFCNDQFMAENPKPNGANDIMHNHSTTFRVIVTLLGVVYFAASGGVF
ncbi:uncharacterized protein LOC110862220 [Folsomia candida]|uniref:Uncharacterized protein n=1 Tax=Folsomia candida TaxID=158441 RepID=A0A226CYC2_FOLCA|nr:uncharacterized protein LOC110862220 [Folsomia candida]OXA37953.1 hypothetical protein Fcan01_27255 [Folsomia candida]